MRWARSLDPVANPSSTARSTSDQKSVHGAAGIGWQPKVKFAGLVKMMVEADLELADRERYLVARAR
jgi:GDP-D-mannose dehydratase